MKSNDIKIGDTYQAKSTVGRFLSGKVVYIHPDRYFVVLEFFVNNDSTTKKVSFRESFSPNQLYVEKPEGAK